MPVPPKAVERRQRGNKMGGDRHISIVREFSEPPSPPPGLLKKTTDEWIAYFAGSDSALVKTVDLPFLERLYWLRDERRRLQRVVRSTRIEEVDGKKVTVSNRFVAGSTGQVVLNPAYAEINKIDSELRQLEDRFALNIRARLSAGAQFATTHRSLDELNREAAADEPDDDRGTEDDPRLAALVITDQDPRRKAAT